MFKRFAAHIVVFALVIVYGFLVNGQSNHPNDDIWGYACLVTMMIIIAIVLPRFIKSQNHEDEEKKNVS